MNAVRVVLGFSLLSAVWCQEFASDCPQPNGYFADAVQCDKYYSCVDNVLSEKVCDDGMVFDDLNPNVEKCDFPFHITCEGRPELQIPQATRHCPRSNGYFAHEDKHNCDQFYFCAKGIGNSITCPESLAFSLKTGTCVWPNESGREDCTAKSVHNFTCPTVPHEEAVAHPRYSDPDDCQFFFVCINGRDPRRNGCKFGEVFNSATKNCDRPLNVADCKDYYKEYFDEYFSSVGGPPGGISTPDVLAAAIGSGFSIPDKPQRVRINQSVRDVNPGAINPPRRRRPTSGSAAQKTNPVVRAEDLGPAGEAPQRNIPERAVGPKTPSGGSGIRRRPVRNRAKITTTTTPAPDIHYDDDYYYYEDEVAAPAR